MSSGARLLGLTLVVVSGVVARGSADAAAPSGVEQAATVLVAARRVDPPDPPPTGSTLSPELQSVLDLTNAERVRAGLAPFTYHPLLGAAALAHATDQRNAPCTSGGLTHTGSDGSNAGTRIARTGLSVRSWAENIACGYTSASSVMNGWMNSSGHRANILNPGLTHIGLALTVSDSGVRYWVQVFGTPR